MIRYGLCNIRVYCLTVRTNKLKSSNESHVHTNCTKANLSKVHKFGKEEVLVKFSGEFANSSSRGEYIEKRCSRSSRF